MKEAYYLGKWSVSVFINKKKINEILFKIIFDTKTNISIIEMIFRQLFP
jgi:hypothetical protein